MWSGHVSSMKTDAGIDAALIGSPARASRLMSARSCWRATRVKRHANCERSGSSSRCRLDPSLGRKAIAKSLKRDVGRSSARLQKITVRHQLGRPMAAVPDRLSRAIPFNPFKPPDATDC